MAMQVEGNRAEREVEERTEAEASSENTHTWLTVCLCLLCLLSLLLGPAVGLFGNVRTGTAKAEPNCTLLGGLMGSAGGSCGHTVPSSESAVWLLGNVRIGTAKAEPNCTLLGGLMANTDCGIWQYEYQPMTRTQQKSFSNAGLPGQLKLHTKGPCEDPRGKPPCDKDTIEVCTQLGVPPKGAFMANLFQGRFCNYLKGCTSQVLDARRVKKVIEPLKAEGNKKAIEPLEVRDDGPVDSATAETHGCSLTDPTVVTKLGSSPMMLTAATTLGTPCRANRSRKSGNQAKRPLQAQAP